VTPLLIVLCTFVPSSIATRGSFMRFPYFLLSIPLLLLCGRGAQAQISHEIAFPNLTFSLPVGIEHAPDGADRLYVVEQPGRIMVFDNDPLTSASQTFLDIRARVNDAGWEEGLLGLAFHPNYADNGYFYVNYTASGPRRTVVSRFERSAADPLAADPTSEQILLQINQPYSNHNGGDLTFGPDGYLYIAVGDGGSGNDPGDHGQNSATLLGTILRVDVDGGGSPPDCGGSTANYTIPDNAIADGPGGACDEIFAYGLRNPWRFSFDPETDWFWVADVGQNRREEVNIVENGDNLGWRVKEGSLCHLTSAYGPPCSSDVYVDPIWEYGFTGGQSITGGFVYRGGLVPEIEGRYVYADFMSGHIWALTYDGTGPAQNTPLFNTNLSISSFGVDLSGNLYFASFDGRIRTFHSASVATEPGEPASRASLVLAGPNPVRGATAFELTAPLTGHATVSILDVLGREVVRLHDGPLAPGSVTMLPLDAGGLAAGIYVARLAVDGRMVHSAAITVVR
jgi:hypothetical protein